MGFLHRLSSLGTEVHSLVRCGSVRISASPMTSPISKPCRPGNNQLLPVFMSHDEHRDAARTKKGRERASYGNVLLPGALLSVVGYAISELQTCRPAASGRLQAGLEGAREPNSQHLVFRQRLPPNMKPGQTCGATVSRGCLRLPVVQV